MNLTAMNFWQDYYATSILPSSSNGTGSIDRIRRRTQTQSIYHSIYSSKLRHQRNRNNMEDSMDFIPSGITSGMY